MSAVAGAIIGGAVLVGGVTAAVISSNASKDAAGLQADAANHATDLQWQQYQTQLENEKPWLKAGQESLGQLQAMSKAPVSFTQQDFLNNKDPSYDFNLQEGQKAIQRSAAAQGTLMSGGTLKDLTSYSQGLASNEYGNAYNRFMNNQNTQFNRLASIAGLGQTAMGQVGASGTATANNVGGIAMSNANAQGASRIAQGNIWGGTLSGLSSGIGNTALGYQSLSNTNNLINRMYPQTSGMAAGYGASAGGSSMSAIPSSTTASMLEVG